MLRKCSLCVVILVILTVSMVLPVSAMCQSEDGFSYNIAEYNYYSELAKLKPVVEDWKNEGISMFSIPSIIPRRGIIYLQIMFIKLAPGHAAITFSLERIVEAVSSGVIITDDDFWDRSEYMNANTYAVTVTDTTMDEDRQAAMFCYNQVGKGYNYIFTNTSTRDKFYCSHLVWAAFYDELSINLNPNGGIVYPMELVTNDEVTIIYSR